MQRAQGLRYSTVPTRGLGAGTQDRLPKAAAFLWHAWPYVFGYTAAIGATIAVLQFSMRCGRLAMPLAFDDISYILAGFDNFDAFRHAQIGHAIALLMTAHAPFQSLLVMLGFLVFGVHPWTAYAANGVLLLLAVTAILYMTRALPDAFRIAILGLGIASPLFINLVAEFRPDLFWGMLCGFACWLILREQSLKGPARNQIPAILVSAAAILWKPSALFPTLAVLGLASIFSLAAAILESEPGPPTKTVALRYVLAIAGVLALILPYFAINAETLLQYMALFASPSHIAPYRTGYTAAQNMNVFLFGDNFKSGLWLWLPLGLAVAILNAAFSPFAAFGSRRRYWFFAAVALWSYVIPTISPVKSFFLGGIFYGCFFCFTLLGLCNLIIWLQLRQPKSAWLAIPVLLAILACELTSPSLATPVNKNQAGEETRIADAVSQALIIDIPRRQDRNPSIFVESPDPVPEMYLGYAADTAGEHLRVGDGYYTAPLSKAEANATHFRYIFLSQSHLSMNYEGDQLSASMIAWALTNPNFKLVAEYTDDMGRHNYLFRANSLAKRDFAPIPSGFGQ